MAIFVIEDGKVVGQLDVLLETRVPHDRIRLMRLEQVDVVVCGGVQDFYEDMLRENGIDTVSWVSGKVEDLLAAFLAGKLVPGKARPIDTAGVSCTEMDGKRQT
jgi:predicted Fe-Mo cluster-binding NifX family protein